MLEGVATATGLDCGCDVWLLTADKLRGATRSGTLAANRRARDKSQGKQAYIEVRKANGTALGTRENQRGVMEQVKR